MEDRVSGDRGTAAVKMSKQASTGGRPKPGGASETKGLAGWSRGFHASGCLSRMELWLALAMCEICGCTACGRQLARGHQANIGWGKHPPLGPPGQIIFLL
ncbi:hypothetical protein GDO78_014068 [Eleutherodactylus coqui]|uniref:Uncharacterized protein n=1 Tax=Eleutherodactylus coqui TaxID=57060 RepID=A0A8J6BF75_ELECQ|nr:hypothetical protein GDO78_014068 [Eleutherodactylus coqui]